VKTVQGDIRWT